MKEQLTELLTQYGTVSGIWFDGHWDQLDNDVDKTLQSKVDWHYNEIYELIHRLQPACLIGNNHHLLPLPGEDFQMFEKDLPGNNTTGFGGAAISALPLETCETMNDSWGYNITDRKFKSVKTLIQYMVKAAAHNANFLLNVGPMPTGTIQPEFTDTLAAIGKWMKVNGTSIYGTRGNIIPLQSWGGVTAKEKTLYVHLLQSTGFPYVFVPGIPAGVVGAVTLADGKKLRFTQQKEGVFIYLDGVTQDPYDTVIQLNY